MAKEGICGVDKCGKPIQSRGYCSSHYRRLLRHGNPLLGNASHGSGRKWLYENYLHEGDDCLQWPFGRTGVGYAVVRFRTGKNLTVASRAMCELAHGPPPESWYEAAHSCGNGSSGCVNPKHLRWTTPTENRRDKLGHGTIQRGTDHYRSKLSAAQVEAIVSQKGLVVQKRLAEKYGVAPGLISRIMNGDHWSLTPKRSVYED